MAGISPSYPFLNWKTVAEGLRRLAAAASRDDVWPIVLDSLEALLGQVAVTVYLRREDSKFFAVDSRRDHPAVFGQAIALGEGHVGVAARDVRAIISPPGSESAVPAPPLLWPEDPQHPPPVSSITVPIVDAADRVVAVIQALAWSSVFANSDIPPVEILGLGMHSAIERTSRVASTRQWARLRLPVLAEPGNGPELSRDRHLLYCDLAKRSLRAAPGAVRSCVRVCDTRRVGGVPKPFLRFVATEGKGWTPKKKNIVYWMDEESAAAHTVTSRQPFLIQDAATEQHYRGIFKGVVSLYCLPLIVRGEVVAVLTLDAKAHDAFPDHVKESVRDLAAEAMAVLDHYALIEDKWLLDFDRRLAPMTKIRDLCGFAAAEMKRVVGARACSVFLTHSSRPELKLEATTAHHPSPEPIYPFGSGITGWIAQQRQAVRIQNTRDAAELSDIDAALQWQNLWPEEINYPDTKGNNSYLGAPLESGSEIVGVVRLSVKENATAFEVNDEALLARMASRLALCVQNLRLAEDNQRRWFQLQESVKLGQKIASNLDLSQVCESILEEGLKITGCEFGHIRRLGPNNSLVLVKAIGPRQRTIPDVRERGEGLSGRALELGQPFFIPDIEEHPLRATVVDFGEDEAGDSAIHAMVSYPLIVETEKIGVLNLHSSERLEFDEQTKAVFADLAARSAVALRTALLYDSVKQALERVEAIGTKFAGTRELGLLIEQVVKGALQQSGMDAATFRLFDGERQRWVLSAAFDRAGEDLSPQLESEMAFEPGEFLDAAFKARLQGSGVAVLQSEDERFLRFRDSVGSPSHKRFLKDISSLAVVPVCLGAARLGVLVLLSKTRLGSPAALRYIPVLASFAAVAIENAKFDEVQKKRQQDEQLVLLGAIMESFRHDLVGSLTALEKAVRHKDWAGAGSGVADLKEIGSAVTKLSALVKGNPKGAFSPIELVPLLNRNITMARSKFFVSCARPSVAPAPDCPATIIGNEHLLGHALRRILENAYRALEGPRKTKAEIRVGLTLESGGRRVCLSIGDNGRGMNAEQVRNLFQPFGIRGRGLYVSRAFVGFHGGDIKVESTLGKGTTVHIFLPVGELQNAS